MRNLPSIHKERPHPPQKKGKMVFSDALAVQSQSFKSQGLNYIIETVDIVDIVKAICKKARLELKQSQIFQWITSESLWIPRLSVQKNRHAI